MKEDEEEHVPPGKPEIVADVDYAQVVGLSDEPPYVPSWYNEDLGAELRHSQACPSFSSSFLLVLFW